MKTSVVCLIRSLAIATCIAAAQADSEKLANVDRRTEGMAARPGLPVERAAAATELLARIPGVQIHLDEILASPKFIYNTHGFLTAPDNEEELLPPETIEMRAARKAAPAAPADPHRSIKRFLDENTVLFGHDSTILSSARISREYVTKHNGLKTVIWEQRLDGIPIFEAVLYGHISKIGELVSLCSQFVPNPALAADQGMPNRLAIQIAPPVSAAEAVAQAAADIGEDLRAQEVQPVDFVPEGPERKQRFTAQALEGEATSSLIWLPTTRDTMRLCWRLILSARRVENCSKFWSTPKTVNPRFGTRGRFDSPTSPTRCTGAIAHPLSLQDT